MVASHMPPTGDLAHSPDMCPDWESNQWSFGSQAGAQSTEPHQPGLRNHFLTVNIYIAVKVAVMKFDLNFQLILVYAFIKNQKSLQTI